jgi:YihY family inner membrane protein
MAVKDRLYRVPVLGTALRMQDRYEHDTADQFAASIGFFGFLSLFPLLLIGVAVAGMVLRDQPDAQRELVRTALDAVPGISAALSGGTAGSEAAQQSQLDRLVGTIIDRAGTIGVVGAVTLLLSGLRVVNAAMTATTRIFHVEVDLSGARTKLRQFGALLMLGGLAVAGVAATAAVGVAVRVDVSSAAGVLASVGSIAVSLLLDFLLFSTAYRLLAVGNGPSFSQIWPGSVLAAVAWTGLKAFGATYVSGQVSRANDLYGVFGGVIALLLLFYLAGRIYLYGAVLSEVLRDPGRDMARQDDAVAFDGDPHPDDPRAGPARHDRPARREGPARIVPTADEASPTISRATTDRKWFADHARDADARADVRGAIAFGLALAAIGGLLRYARPWDVD